MPDNFSDDGWEPRNDLCSNAYFVAVMAFTAGR
jgi:hypothetical protein